MMVLPILVSSYKKKTAEARIDKFFSTMQQAILFSEANNGDIDNWDEPVSQSEVSDWFDKYIAKYIKFDTVEKNESSNFSVYLSDGSYFELVKNDCIDVLYDMNGKAKPNMHGRDKFYFLICQSPANREKYYFNKKFNIGPYSSYGGCTKGDRACYLEKCATAPSYSCSALFIEDGLRFSDDYPFSSF